MTSPGGMEEVVHGTMTASVTCTSCGLLPDASAHGISDSGIGEMWNVRVGGVGYRIPWHPLEPHPPCHVCGEGRLMVTDPEILHMTVSQIPS